MKDLIIHKTQDTPEVSFLADGHFTIEGRSFNEDPKKFFDPLISICQKLSIDTLHLEIKMDYLNTASSKMLVELLQTIDANTNIGRRVINWYYEEDDEDILETGQIIEETTFASNFYYYEVAAA